MFRIRIFDGQGHLVQQIPLSSHAVTFGRDPSSTIPIPEINVSRNHAILEPSGNFFILRDLGSTNGTWVNKNPIKTHILKDGDIVCIGSYRIFAEQMSYSYPQSVEEIGLSKTSEMVIDENVFAFDKSPKSGKTIFRNLENDAPPDQGRKVLERLERLQQISRDIGLIETLDVLYQKVLEIIIGELKADRAAFLIPGAPGSWNPAAALTTSSAAADGRAASFDIHPEVLETVISGKTALLAQDASEDSRFPNLTSDRTGKVRSIMCVPLLTQKDFQGVIYLDRINNTAPFTDEDLWFLTVIASQVTTSLANARLFQDVLSEKRKVQTIIENLQDGLIITAHDFTIDKFNNAASLLILGKVSYLIGKKLSDILKSKGEAFNEDLFRLAIAKNGAFPFLTRVNETRQYFTVNVTPFPIGGKKEMGYQFIFRDTTAFMNLEFLKTEFIRIASHKLRTPLTVLLGSLELLKITPDAELAQTRGFLIDGIEKNFEQMQSLVNRFVEFTELDANLELLRDVDIEETISASWGGLASMAELRKVSLVKHWNVDDEFIIQGNSNRLIQCFNNILHNSIKYSPEHGRVDIFLESTPEVLRLQIQDQGPGIAPEHLPFIFSGFYQAEKIPTGEAPGAGLGLTISRRILQLHHATIQVTSPVQPGGKGTSISITFHRENQRIATTKYLDKDLLVTLL